MFYLSFLPLQLVRNMQSLNEQSIVHLEGLQCRFSAPCKDVLVQSDVFTVLVHCLAG